jgi:indolepyruvate ferredoxin oxidoreductase, alpha subunit
VVAVIGDSTFLHTGINGLMDMVYNGSTATVIILDNRITAMTGRQENPTSGYTLDSNPAFRVDLEQLCARSLGVEHVRIIDPYGIALTRKTLRERWRGRKFPSSSPPGHASWYPRQSRAPSVFLRGS